MGNASGECGYIGCSLTDATPNDTGVQVAAARLGERFSHADTAYSSMGMGLVTLSAFQIAYTWPRRHDLVRTHTLLLLS